MSDALMSLRAGFILAALAGLAPGALAAPEAGPEAGAEPAARRLSPVEIFGDRPEGAPGARSVIGEEVIRRTAADRPADILNQAPGVLVQMNSGQEHLISLRSPVLTAGAGQGSFLILENGTPLRSPAFGNVNSLIEPHHEIATGIEIIRGPASARHGSNAVHGLFNFFLPRPGDAQMVRASYGSHGRWRADGSVDLSPSLRFSLSLLDEEGWRDAAPGQQQKISLTSQAGLAGWDLDAWLAASSLNQETAGFIQGRDAYKDRTLSRTNPVPEAFRDAWSARVGARFSREAGPGRLVLTPSARSQAMIFSQHFLPYGGIEKNGHSGAGLSVLFDREAGAGMGWQVGVQGDLARGYLKEIQPDPHPSPAFPQGVHYDYQVTTSLLALWAEAGARLGDDLRVIAGLRAETHAYDYDTRIPAGISGRFNVAADRQDDFSFLTPKLGLVWEQSWGEVYVNYARGARAPQVSDLYRLQSRQQVGEVRSERVDSLEAGLRGRLLSGRLAYELAAYHMDKDNFFFRDSDGLNVTAGATRHQGVEADASLEVTPDLRLSGNVAWSRQTYRFDRPVNAASERILRGNRIDTAPEWLADLSLSWQASDRLRLTLSGEHVGAYFMDPANTAVYPGHTILSARAGLDIAEGLEGFILIRNLTDEAYADRADIGFGNPRYFPGEPVNAVFGVTRNF